MSLMDLTLPRVRRFGFAELFATMERMNALRRQRAALRRFDARALEDIGVSRAEAEAEAARPVWDAPMHWTR